MLAALVRRRPRLVVAALVAVLVKLLRVLRSLPRGPPVAFRHWLQLIHGDLPLMCRMVARNQLNDYFFSVFRQWGRTWVPIPSLVSLISPGVVMTMDPKNVEHIFKTRFDNYPKGTWLTEKLSDLLGRGIFSVDGPEWAHQRKTASPMFTARLFKEHIWVVVDRNARRLRSMLETVDPDKPLDIFNLLNRFTLDTIGEIGFGKSIGSLENPTSPFLVSFDKAQQISFRRFVNPAWWPTRLLRLGYEKEAAEHFDRLDEYSRGLVRELRSAMEAGSSKVAGVSWADLEARKSFVGLFLEEARKQGETLSEDYLRDLVLNFLIAGRDTTAQALSWTIFCLSCSPTVEAKVRQEIIDTCGIRGPSYDDLSRMRYLDAVLSEALRLYPSVPFEIKIAKDNDTLPDGTWVPRGTVMVIHIFGMGRDQATWGEDAEIFRPERWLAMEEKPSNSVYPVFWGGPRECLGRRLAMVEMKTCLAMLLPSLSLKLAVPPEEVVTDSQLTIGMGRGLPCFVRKTAEAEVVPSCASTAAASTAALSDGEIVDGSCTGGSTD